MTVIGLAHCVDRQDLMGVYHRWHVKECYAVGQTSTKRRNVYTSEPAVPLLEIHPIDTLRHVGNDIYARHEIHVSIVGNKIRKNLNIHLSGLAKL